MTLIANSSDVDIRVRRMASAHYASVQRLAFSYLFGTLRAPWRNPNEDIRTSLKIYLEVMINCLPYPMTIGFETNKMETAVHHGNDQCLYERIGTSLLEHPLCRSTHRSETA